MAKKNNRIAVFLGHPAHFHLYKNMVSCLSSKNYDVVYLIKRKDILENLVKQSGIKYVVVRDKERSQSSVFGLIQSMLKMDWQVMKYLLKIRPRVLTGTYCPIFSFFTTVPFISCNEDDALVVPRFAMLSYPPSKAILTPIVCNNGRWDKKSTKYPSYHELAYLHPNHFTADKTVVEGYGIDTTKPYFVMRFASLKAHHDDGVKGINTEIAQRLIDILSPHGHIYITSERELEPQFEPYRIRINPLDMHHVMAFASLYLGDSQTMAAEAGVLGTPFVRFNDFVGRIGYLQELEDFYQLGYGVHASPLAEDSPIRRIDGTLQPSGTQALYDAVEQLVAMPADERKALYTARREKMLSEKIDFAKFLTWFIENYPTSQQQTRENQENQAFWEQFK